MPLIATPVKDNFYKKADLYLAKTTNTNLFVKKYGWLKSRYGNIELYSRDEVENILKKLQQENFIQEYNKNKKIIAEAVKKAKKILKIEDRYIIDLMRFFIYYRTQRTDIMNYASYRYANKLEKIAKDKGVSYEDILYCTRKEIESDMINAINIQERKKAWSIVANKNDFQIVTGEDNKKLVDIFSNLEKHGDEIKGKPVFHGVVTGKVRIIKRKDQLSSLAKGDILVTSMTTPDMIPAMKKVAAFVTDEGGITCHAAIIAREMKKPCITGTKNATQVLKDGDLVEVDANKGIVKIIR